MVRTERRCRRCFLKVIYIPPLLRGGRWVVIVVWCYSGSGGGRHRIELIKKKEKKPIEGVAVVIAIVAVVGVLYW